MARALVLAAVVAMAHAAPVAAGVNVEEATIGELQAAMADGRVTSVALVEAYRARIAALDRRGPVLRSVVELNPQARAIAAERDRERRAGRVRGPLHGIPVLVKDNLDTGDRMQTSAGSLALVGAPAPKDAFAVARLRAAGAVILGKTNLSEWANLRSPKSTSGWSSRGGQTRNPYVLDRNPCGSSSGTGTAVAASLAAAGVGTETDGSIVCPASATMLVGVKPTLGLVSRSGIVPVAASQDTAGPMARTVEDAALLLAAMAGADRDDPASVAASLRVVPDYRPFLAPDRLRGARIGVMRARVTGYSGATDALFERALADLRALGAEIVDPVDPDGVGDVEADELDVLLFEFRDGLDRYLATRRGVPVRTLADVIAFNRRHAAKTMPHFGQEFLEAALAKGPLTDPVYRDKRARIQRLTRAGLDTAFAAHRLDALVAPTTGPMWVTDHAKGDAFAGGSSTIAAASGYPSVSVPMGLAGELPVGLSFIGPAWSEGPLLGLAYAYEQGTRHRRPPRFLPTLP